MAGVAEMSAEEFLALKDFDCGTSGWTLIDQARIDKFAETTGDFQYIHVDPERAATTAFGGTIAHGALILALLAGTALELLPAVRGLEMGINFGFDRVRFLAPVPCGAQVRSHIIIRHVAVRGENMLQTTMLARVDLAGQEKPALVADWIVLMRLAP